MDNWLSISLMLLCLIYSVKIFTFYLGLFKLRKGTNQKLFSVSIILAAKNEADNIGRCLDSLLALDYPAHKMEIIVVDDHSADATARLVQQYAKFDSRVKLIRLIGETTVISSKKQALECGIENSSHDIIFTTDADCFAPPGWLRAMITYFEPQTGMVAGPVLYEETKSVFSRIQSLEFIGLITAGAGSIGLGRPIIANGANLAYRKAAFQQVNGFEGQRQLASGDDDLLMQKIARETNWNIAFAADRNTFIKTAPVDNLFDFLNQRSRWASKGAYYPTISLVLFLIATYFFYVLLLVMLPLTIFANQEAGYYIVSIIMKFLVDFLVVSKGCEIFHKKYLLKYFLVAEILQVPYIVYAGLTGFMGKFKWKD